MPRERDRIQLASTTHIVAVYSRGVIFSEHSCIEGAQGTMDVAPALNNDGYGIYTRSEWENGYQAPGVSGEVHPEILRAEQAASH